MLMCFIFREGKAFAAEQKIRAFKKILLISKQFEKMEKKKNKTKSINKKHGRKYK